MVGLTHNNGFIFVKKDWSLITFFVLIDDN
jgi:hypothetical protein